MILYAKTRTRIMKNKKTFPNKAQPEDIAAYEAKWGTRYKNHPLIDFVDFIPTEWLVSIGSGKDDLASNNIDGEMLSGEKLNEAISKDGMVHPLIVSINGVGDDYKVRLDCGQHRARVALLVAGIDWLPCFVEVSPGASPYIRANGPHEYPIDRNLLLRKPDIEAQFMRPSALFSRYIL